MLADRTTLVQFLIEERRRHPGASGDLNGLILNVALACKTVARRVAEGELGDVLGVSEELAPGQYPRGKYLLVFDPLDGSSNIDVNVPVGSIFSILRAPNPG